VLDGDQAAPTERGITVPKYGSQFTDADRAARVRTAAHVRGETVAISS